MKLNYFETLGAEELLSAVPMRKLDAKAVAETAMTLSAVARANAAFRESIAKAANGFKPEGYDEKARQREAQIKELFPEGKEFDPEVWEKECKDKDFEKVFAETEAAFKDAVDKIGATPTEVNVRLSPDTLASIAQAMAQEDTVKVGSVEMPFENFICKIALLAE